MTNDITYFSRLSCNGIGFIFYSNLQGLVMKFLKRDMNNMKIYEKLELLEKSYREMKEIILMRKEDKIVITIGSGKEAQKIILNDDAVK
jgi:hypothetical protein